MHPIISNKGENIGQCPGDYIELEGSRVREDVPVHLVGQGREIRGTGERLTATLVCTIDPSHRVEDYHPGGYLL